jgi:hypothetical protein
MKKYVVTIEFRYSSVPDGIGSTHRSKTITLGVFDVFDDACASGNQALEHLESRFELHQFPQGHYAPRERFSKNGGCFGYPKTLITNLAYLKTPFVFYAKIDTLNYESLADAVDGVIESVKNYREFGRLELED